MPCRPSNYGKGKWEGDKYKGHWKRGNFHGHGTYTRSDGHKFVGEWKNNVLNDITEYDKYGNLVRHILIIFSILLLYSPLFGQVDADSSKEFDPTLLSNISISLISEFLKEVEPLPPAGISMDTCIYHIDAVKVKETTFVTFKGKNLNSFGDSKLSGPDGFQESVLKALYRALEDKRKLICETYGEFIEKCGGVVKKIPAEKIETIREMEKKYDLFEKRIAVLDTRIERMNNGAVKVVTNPHSIGFDGMYYIVFPPEHSGVKANIIALVGGKWFPTGAHKVGFFAFEETCYDEPVVLKVEKDKTKGLFVAVGDNGTILTSPDGTTWTQRTSTPGPFGARVHLYDVTYGNGLFVTVGGDNGTILTSPDGTTWAKRNSGTSNDLYGVTYGNGLFVTVGEYGTFLTSPDGTTWTKSPSDASATAAGPPGPAHRIYYGKGLFVTYGTKGKIHTSPDGTTWTERTCYYGASPCQYAEYGTPQDLEDLHGLTYGNGLFVAVGDNGTILTSPDGTTWAKRNSGTSEEFLGVAYGNGIFLTIGLNGNILISPDGTTWTEGSYENSYSYGFFKAATYGNGLFVTVSKNGAIQTSPDGTTWTERTSGISGWLREVIYSQ